jgi:hypothetical protein
MKRLVLAVLLLASAPLVHAGQAAPATDAPAADATAMADDAQIDRLLQVMRARETVEAMWPQIEASQRQMVQGALAGKTLDADKRARLDALLARNNARIHEAMSWDKLEPLYRDIYRKTFSAGDMAAMIDFYGSPAGQFVLEKMPQLMQHMMEAMQQLLVPMLRQIQQDVQSDAVAPPAG